MAGFFGLFDYTRPGKGVSKDEPQKPRFLKFWGLFFGKFWRLVQLNLLYIAFCLPILTIGPATAGLIYVLRNLANEQPVFIFSDFWDGFKNNFLQSTMYSLLFLFCSRLLWASIEFYMENAPGAVWMYVPLGLCMMMALFFIFMSFYIFLLIVTIDLKLRLILKNAAILSIACLKTNLVTFLSLSLIFIAVYRFQPLSVLVCLLIIPAFAGFIVCFNSYPGIKMYIIEPYLASIGQDASKTSDGGIFHDKLEEGRE